MIKGISTCWELASHDSGTEGMTWGTSISMMGMRNRICRQCLANPMNMVIHEAFVFNLNPKRGLEADISNCCRCGRRLMISLEHHYPVLPHGSVYHYNVDYHAGTYARNRCQTIVPQYGDIGHIS